MVFILKYFFAIGEDATQGAQMISAEIVNLIEGNAHNCDKQFASTCYVGENMAPKFAVEQRWFN